MGLELTIRKSWRGSVTEAQLLRNGNAGDTAARNDYYGVISTIFRDLLLRC